MHQCGKTQQRFLFFYKVIQGESVSTLVKRYIFFLDKLNNSKNALVVIWNWVHCYYGEMGHIHVKPLYSLKYNNHWYTSNLSTYWKNTHTDRLSHSNNNVSLTAHGFCSYYVNNPPDLRSCPDLSGLEQWVSFLWKQNSKGRSQVFWECFLRPEKGSGTRTLSLNISIEFAKIYTFLSRPNVRTVCFLSRNVPCRYKHTHVFIHQHIV